MQPVSKQRIGKHAYNYRGIVGNGVFFSVRAVVIRKSSVENRQSSSGVPSKQLVESWALQGRLRRWRYEFRCWVLTSGQRRDRGSWKISIVKVRYQETSSEHTAEKWPLLRALTKQRLVKDREGLAWSDL
jgi:hypothetical protein